MISYKLLAYVAILMCATPCVAQRKTCIDADWRFRYSDGSTAIHNPAATAAWRHLDLPHDWSVETEAAEAAGGRVVGPFSTNSIGKFQTGHTVGGEGWYARTIHATAADLQGRVELYFEGAYNQSWVYVNGQLCHENVYGYTSFRVDITSQLREGDNALLVRVVNSGNNSRWYAGSGIYRHVWLIRTPRLHLDEWDCYLKMENEKITVRDRRAQGQLTVETTVHNDGEVPVNGSLCVNIVDSQGAQLTSATAPFSTRARDEQPLKIDLDFTGAQPWSPEQPYLYAVNITLKDTAGETIDHLSKRIGIRTLSFSPTEGFRLNGIGTLLRGGCVHHDNGLLGAAAFDKAERRKLTLLKAQGYNAVRCSHNLPSENFLDLCDELGLMVIDECFDQWLLQKNGEDYHRFFRDHSDEDVATMVRRDRNHPSIIMWSIGNEIPGRIEPEGIQTAARLRADVLRYDTTRPITAAICGWDAGDTWNSAGGNWDAQDAKAFESLDIGGYNYLYDKYQHDHQTHPDRVMCGLESYPKLASENWTMVERLPYVIGDFVWTAMDYLGEAGIGAAYPERQPPMFQDWPWFNGYCGDLDLIGQKKPQSYYRDVVWRQRPITMAVQSTSSYNNAWGWQLEEQSWTLPGHEGEMVTVNVYSRAPRVRLYLNDKVVGEAAPGSTFWAGFQVSYAPGTLRAVNIDNSGNEVADERFELTTTGAPASLRLIYEDETLTDDPGDLAYVTIELVDAEGRVVTSDCSTQVSIENTGCGQLIACGTASPTDMKSFRSNTVKLFRGRALAIIRSTGKAGNVNIEAQIQEPEPTTYFYKNAAFEEESLTGWTVSDSRYIRFNPNRWHDTELNGFLECYVGLGDASTLGGQSFSQSTKVLPAGQYELTFNYNGTFLGSNHYQTNGDLSGVEVSIGGQRAELKTIDGNDAKQGCIRFTLAEPQAVTFLVQFDAQTNADWFAFDNLCMNYSGLFDFQNNYIDKSELIPLFGSGNWPRMEGNAAGSYTETKLGSAIYNQEGLAYWSPTAPTGTDLFRDDIRNLPSGRYGLTALAAANLWSGSDDDRNPQHGTYFFAATDGGNEARAEVATATYGLYSIVIDVQEGKTLTIGLHADEDNGNNWCYLGPMTLVRMGDSKTAMNIIIDESATTLPNRCAFADVTLIRSLQSSKWNTFSVPFNITAEQLANSPLSSCTVYGFQMSDATSITFSNNVTSIDAGKPYLVLLPEGVSDIVNPTFNSVSIEETEDVTMGDPGCVQFVGQIYNKSLLSINDVCYLDDNGKVKQLAANGTIKGLRAYFIVPDAQQQSSGVKLFFNSIEDGIQTMANDQWTMDNAAIYNLAGQRLQKVQRGVNIVNGKKVLVK